MHNQVGEILKVNESRDDISKNVSGFRTDYQFITKSKMRTIPKMDKEEKYYSLQQQRKSLQPSKYKGYSDFIFTQLPKTGYIFFNNPNFCFFCVSCFQT